MEAKDILKRIALETFGTNDGVRPKIPKSGKVIQTAMELSFKAGYDQAPDELAWRLRALIEVKDAALLKVKLQSTGNYLGHKEGQWCLTCDPENRKHGEHEYWCPIPQVEKALEAK